MNLNVIFTLILQGKVAQTACMSTCKHLAASLMRFLVDANTRFISMGAIQQFSLDVIQCERKISLVLILLVCYGNHLGLYSILFFV